MVAPSSSSSPAEVLPAAPAAVLTPSTTATPGAVLPDTGGPLGPPQSASFSQDLRGPLPASPLSSSGLSPAVQAVADEVSQVTAAFQAQLAQQRAQDEAATDARLVGAEAAADSKFLEVYQSLDGILTNLSGASLGHPTHPGLVQPDKGASPWSCDAPASVPVSSSSSSDDDDGTDPWADLAPAPWGTSTSVKAAVAPSAALLLPYPYWVVLGMDPPGSLVLACLLFHEAPWNARWHFGRCGQSCGCCRSRILVRSNCSRPSAAPLPTPTLQREPRQTRRPSQTPTLCWRIPVC